MDNHTNKKVYINPNFNRNGTYLNKNFTHQLPNEMQNSQRKIFVNPSIIAINKNHINFQPVNKLKQQNVFEQKSLIDHQNKEFIVTKGHITQDTEQICLRNRVPEISLKFCQSNQKIVTNPYSSNINITKSIDQSTLTSQLLNDTAKFAVAPVVNSRYCLVNYKSVSKNNTAKMAQISPLQNTIQQSHSIRLLPNSKPPKLNSTKSRYCIIRNNKPVIPNIRSIKKNCTIKISKYKVISLRNYNIEPKTQPQSDALTKTTVVKTNKPIMKLNTTPSAIMVKNSIRNSSKLKGYTNYRYLSSEKAETAKLNLQNNKKNPNVNTKFRGSFKINNMPCQLYIKYGKCLRKAKGNCEFLHDKKHVSLCRKFLKGICHDINCLLSHELSDKKMPTCYFYLKGMCTKEHCPYVHIKLSEKTKTCQDFLKGYCEKGNKCLLRHVRKHHSVGIPGSSLNKCGRLAQTVIKKSKNSPKEVNKAGSSLKTTINSKENDNSDLEGRYYKSVETAEDQQCEIIKPSRCKLGILPSFIQLK